MPASAAKMPYWGQGVKGNQAAQKVSPESVSDVPDGVARGPTEVKAHRAKLLSLQRDRLGRGPAVTRGRWQMACKDPPEGVRMSSRVAGV